MFDWNDLIAAFAIYLVIEGVLPFLSPGGWKRSVETIAQMDERSLRIVGLISMVAGVVLLAFVRG